MRVGLVIYGDLNTLSGGFMYDRMLVEALHRRGHQVEIISLPWRSYVGSLRDNWSSDLHERLRDARLDVLLQDELNHPSLFSINRRLKRQVRYPLISIAHHLRCNEWRPAWQNYLVRWLEARYLATVDGFVFNSQDTCQSVERLLGRPIQPGSIVAYPGGDRLRPRLTLDQIALRATQRGPLQLIFIGNLIPRKELRTLLDALARLPQEKWRLEVIGSLTADTAYTQSIRLQIARDFLTNRVTLLGPLPDAVLAERLALSHVLAVPSSYEGLGIVYLEGMGFGLPAIASNAGGAGEIITPGREGFLVKPNDAATLAEHIRKLSQDRNLLADMSLAAHARYVAHPTWAQTTQRICEFLEGTTAGM